MKRNKQAEELAEQMYYEYLKQVIDRANAR
jgi:hypothetical protein